MSWYHFNDKGEVVMSTWDQGRWVATAPPSAPATVQSGGIGQVWTFTDTHGNGHWAPPAAPAETREAPLTFKIGDTVRTSGTDNNADYLEGTVATIEGHLLVLSHLPGFSWPIKWFELVPGKVREALLCDCGGFKTYQTMAPEVHSHWCSSQRENEINILHW